MKSEKCKRPHFFLQTAGKTACQTACQTAGQNASAAMQMQQCRCGNAGAATNAAAQQLGQGVTDGKVHPTDGKVHPTDGKVQTPPMEKVTPPMEKVSHHRWKSSAECDQPRIVSDLGYQQSCHNFHPKLEYFADDPTKFIHLTPTDGKVHRSRAVASARLMPAFILPGISLLAARFILLSKSVRLR